MAERRSRDPRVSVVVPTHQRADVLPRALASVLAQSLRSFEVIVVDDASSDATPAVVREHDDDRIRYHRFEKRRGANAARNRGIELAEADLVSFLDSDDEFHAPHLERVVETFTAGGPERAGVFTAFELVRDGQSVGGSRAPDGRLTREQIVAENVVGGFSCVTFRTSLFDRIGRLDESLPSSQDYDFFLRAVIEGFELFGLDEVLVTCHLGQDRISADPKAAREGARRILEKHRDRLTGEGRSRLHYYQGFRHARAGEMTAARRAFRAAIRCQPTRWSAYLHLAAASHPTVFELLLRAKERVRTKPPP